MDPRGANKMTLQGSISSIQGYDKGYDSGQGVRILVMRLER